MKTLTLKIDSDIFEQVTREAKARGINRSEFVRRAIRRELGNTSLSKAEPENASYYQPESVTNKTAEELPVLPRDDVERTSASRGVRLSSTSEEKKKKRQAGKASVKGLPGVDATPRQRPRPHRDVKPATAPLPPDPDQAAWPGKRYLSVSAPGPDSPPALSGPQEEKLAFFRALELPEAFDEPDVPVWREIAIAARHLEANLRGRDTIGPALERILIEDLAADPLKALEWISRLQAQIVRHDQQRASRERERSLRAFDDAFVLPPPDEGLDDLSRWSLFGWMLERMPALHEELQAFDRRHDDHRGFVNQIVLGFSEQARKTRDLGAYRLIQKNMVERLRVLLGERRAG